MTWRERLKKTGLALGLLIVCIPLAIVITIFSSPIWRWVETVYNIESFGHSGPAEWCYIVVYFSLVIIGKVFLANLKKNNH